MVVLFGNKVQAPFVVASGPLTRSLEFLKKAEDAGVEAVSTKLTISKVPYTSQLRCYSIPGMGLIEPTDRRLDVEEGLELIRKAREETSLVIYANLSGVEPEDWGPLCKTFEEAGAHIIETNYCCPHLGLTKYLSSREKGTKAMGASIGQVPLIASKVTAEIKKYVGIPIVCKLPPSSFLIETAIACEEAGADGIHLYGGPLLGLPPVDIDNNGLPLYPLLDGASFGSFLGPWVKHSTFRYIAEASNNLNIPIIASGGAQSWQDAIMMIMWGATAVSVCTEIMWRGFEVASNIINGMLKFLEDSSYKSFDEFRGISLRHLMGSEQVKLIEGIAQVNRTLCVKCGACKKVGHCNAVLVDKEGFPYIDENSCLGCSICESLCKQNAITMLSLSNKQDH